MTYDEDEVVQKHMALKNVSVSIKRGEKIAFCGRTGSGKTSILNALFKLYPICKGDLYINGVEHRDLSLGQLRNQMAIIPQFGFLYNATLRENLDPNDEVELKVLQNIY